ncbi:MAG: hypothetical protein HYX94_05430 [Chloroflexi bacterium]|nr:hypothetical protein [Chloroflexota bacterium]
MGALLSWTNLIIAGVALVLVLVAFRVFGRIRLTFRFRGAVIVSPWAQQPCPHLGLLDEPFIHRDDPTEEHRCYLWMQRDRVDLTHQKGFCLSSAHTQCPWMSIAPPIGQAPMARKLGTAAPAALGSFWGRFSDESVGFLVWLILKLNRLSLLARHWADKAVPVVVTLAVIASHEAATRASAAGRAIAKASGVAGHAFLVWLKTNAAHFGSLARDSAREAWKSRTTPAASAAPPVEVSASAEPDVETPAPAPKLAAPSFEPAPATGAASHLHNLIEQGKTAGMSGNRRLAYSLFSLAVDLDPKNDEAWLWKGAMTDNGEEKFVCIQQALAIDPNNQKAQQAYRQMAQGPWAARPDSQGAVPASRQSTLGLSAQRGAPGLAVGAAAGEEALISAALMSLERGDEEGANRLFVRATEVNPTSEKAWFWRAKTAATLGDVIYSLQQALAINPENEKVRANLLWAIQRQQKEEEMAAVERQAVKEEVKAKKEVAKSRRRSPVSRGFRWLASLACLALAAYWLLVALLPLASLPVMKQAFVDFQGVAEVDLSEASLLYHSASQWLPELSWASLPWNDKLEVAPGYNLLAAVPYVIGFLYLFVALGLARREGWSRFWAVAATAASIGLLVMSGANASAAVLAGGLGLVAIATLVLSRSEFQREKGEGAWQPAPFAKIPATAGNK